MGLQATLNKVVLDLNGQFILIDIAIGEEVFTVSCLYAPTQDKPQEQAEFLHSVESALDTLAGINIV